MNHPRRIAALVIALIMIASSFVFASSAIIVSPAQNSIVDTDTLLVSVKVLEKQSVNITVYEETIAQEVKCTDGKAVYKDGKKVFEFLSEDVSKFTEDDLALIAAGKTKDDKGKDILLSDGSKIKTYSDVVFAETVKYENTKSVGIYTKQLSDLQPGLYKVKVELLDEEGKISETIFNLVAVKEAENQNLLNSKDSGIKTTIQSIVKKILK